MCWCKFFRQKMYFTMSTQRPITTRTHANVYNYLLSHLHAHPYGWAVRCICRFTTPDLMISYWRFSFPVFIMVMDLMSMEPCAAANRHQLMSGFHLPRESRQSLLPANYRVIMRWYRELCTDLLTFTLHLRKTPQSRRWRLCEQWLPQLGFLPSQWAR